MQCYRLGEEWLESCLAEKDLGGVGRLLAEHEPAVYPGGQEGQEHPGLYQEQHAWLNQDLPVKLKSKKEMQKEWKEGQVSWEEYWDAARLCRDGVRKAKVQLGLNLARDAKSNKGFYSYVSQKRKVKESIKPPNEQDWQTGNNEPGEGWVAFFASVFTGNLSPHIS
ncbi:hypothetical protein llap_2820 [Limosa lapponica baueri]|uniref:Rna-directed dna polymerase from mobile element jockey-like n=1 Tax=Limosa lapponica baueri TaxID=1758121 RepID=A0A2I0ULB8_LIMLA|nr:hypothetical protein llap_2820 [Limosa lapponica baueri]